MLYIWSTSKIKHMNFFMYVLLIELLNWDINAINRQHVCHDSELSIAATNEWRLLAGSCCKHVDVIRIHLIFLHLQIHNSIENPFARLFLHQQYYLQFSGNTYNTLYDVKMLYIWLGVASATLTSVTPAAINIQFKSIHKIQLP